MPVEASSEFSRNERREQSEYIFPQQEYVAEIFEVTNPERVEEYPSYREQAATQVEASYETAETPPVAPAEHAEQKMDPKQLEAHIKALGFNLGEYRKNVVGREEYGLAA